MKVTKLVNGKQAVWRPTKYFRRNKNKCLKRDDYKCTICGRTTRLHIHHIIPRDEGGTEALKNLVTLCSACHMTVTNTIDQDKIVDRCVLRALKEVHKEIEAAFKQ